MSTDDGVVGVTGATGHLGACLVRQLLARGAKVRVLVRNPNAISLAGLELERVTGDICNRDDVSRFMHGVDQLFHLAARISLDRRDEVQVHQTNVEAAGHIARIALQSGVRRMVHVSSVHGFCHHPRGTPIDETRPRTQTGPAYGVSKAVGEVRIRRVVDQGLDAVIVHPSGIVGPFDYAPSPMGRVILDLCRGRLPLLVAGGFDWVDVRDVANSCIAAQERGETGHSYILSGHYHPLTDLAHIVANIAGVRAPRLVTPMWLARLGVPWVEAWARTRGKPPLYTAQSLAPLAEAPTYIRDKAAEALGHEPRPLRHSIRDALASFATTGQLERGMAPQSDPVSLF